MPKRPLLSRSRNRCADSFAVPVPEVPEQPAIGRRLSWAMRACCQCRSAEVHEVLVQRFLRLARASIIPIIAVEAVRVVIDAPVPIAMAVLVTAAASGAASVALACADAYCCNRGRGRG